MKKYRLSNILILMFFILLTVMMTYPIAFKMSYAVRDTGDPLLNTWILAWDINKITSLDFKNLFNANIFYPHKRVLAYSEHMFSNALIALPLLLISKNPILAYNFVLLFSFVMCGFAMYLLAYYLSENRPGAIAAGVIYAFSPFMFAHLFHVQVISAWGIPLSLLFLHKFFDKERCKDLFLFTLFYLFQVLANGYYAMYLTLFAGLIILYHTIKEKKFLDISFLLKIGLFVVGAAIIITPFFYQYIAVKKEMGFVRVDVMWADITSYLTTSPINRLYGKITAGFYRPEGELFPGLITFILALIGICSIYHKKYRSIEKTKNRRIYYIRKIFNLLILLSITICILIILTGGFNFSILGFRMKATRLKNPILFITILVIIRLLIDKGFRKKTYSWIPYDMENKNIIIYFYILILSFLLTLGPEIHFMGKEIYYGPYLILQKHVPGFDGLRVSSRFFIFVILSMGIFTAIGVKNVLKNINRWKRYPIMGLILILILAEYFSIPVPLSNILVKDSIPEVYRWLVKQHDDIALIELPLPRWEKEVALIECPRVYYSAYHRKKIFNGFSGYSPPLYDEMMNRIQILSREQNINDFRDLGIRYIILHSNFYNKEDFERMHSELSSIDNNTKFMGKFEDDYVYEIFGLKEKKEISKNIPAPALLPEKGWVVKSNVNNHETKYVTDRDILTRWNSGLQKPGVYLEIDIGFIRHIKGVSLKLGTSHQDYPRGYIVEVSKDGINWLKIAGEERTIIPIRAFLKPKDLSLDITFPPVDARYIKITNTKEDKNYYWSVYELEVLIDSI